MVLAVIPFGDHMAAINMNIGLLYLLAIGSLSTLIIWMGAWASNNKYSLLGGMRVVAQMISYELPMVMGILGVIMITGSLNMSDIISAQDHVWFIFTQPLAFLVYFIAAVAECNRTPFDLIEGESELVNGFNTEYGGMTFAMFYLAEYANMLVVCALTTILFLGGWHAPFGWTIIPSWIWFFLKMYVVMFVIMQLRWTYPRIRVDQLLGFGWKILVPISLANIFITGVGMYIYQAIRW
jgi:NADH-quinone oxidoreductase subunit H